MGRRCRACAIGVGETFLAALCAVGLVSMFPAVRQELFVAIHTYCDPGGVPFNLGSVLLFLGYAIGCKGDYIGCVKPEQTKDLIAAYGWQPGTGITFAPPLPGKFATMEFSHAAYSRVAHSPTSARSPDMFILSNMSMLPPGVIPEGVAPSLLNLNTDNPEHFKRRSVMMEVFKALDQHPRHVDEIIAPPKVRYSLPVGQPLSSLWP